MEGKKILVVGLGNSGKAAVQAAVKLEASVSVQDSKTEDKIDQQMLTYLKENDVQCFFGNFPEDMSVFDMLIVSPGVPLELGFIKEAEKAGAEIIGELEVAYREGKGKYAAITGTNGKTTTTTLVGEIYKASGRTTHVVGNIGVAVISKALSADEDDWLVTECSSFQLESIKEFKPEVSAILNLTPDHLDRHKTMENYGHAKAQIFANQDENQYYVVNYDDKDCFALTEKCKAKVVPFSRKDELEFGAYVSDGMIVIADENGERVEICSVDELKIPGTHNLENALAACAVGYFGGIDKEVIAKTLRTFSGVEHRIEFCSEINGVRYVNDSKGTNPDAAIKAIEAMKENIILIAGGYDKNSEYDEFVSSFEGRVKKLLLLGKTADKIKAAAEKVGFTEIVVLKDMEECVKEANRIAEPGDVVLLSPACASWDMYTSFEQRGNHFKECVGALER